MIPTVVARQTRETILDYLRTTFALADARLADALFAFLDSPNGLFRGPYLDVRLPFRKADASATIPLDIAPTFTPYRHQLRAFERLHARDHRPQATIVTTGTGSGKTECFLYPVLDHCWRRRGKPGIKAILLYPMNALAADQARRLAKLLWQDPRLKGQVSAGLYVGEDGAHGVGSAEHLVDQRGVLRQSPPDILLTNYRMLDFLLLRPEDQGLWRHNGPDTLRYLVLDELHTYDGAQGSDVACLIRRLKARLQAPSGSVCPVGTSATLGGHNQEESAQSLVAFATKVFGEEFDRDSVITEERSGMVETLGDTVDDYVLPALNGDLDAQRAETLEAWVARQARLWLPDLPAGEVDPVDLAARLQRHGFLRQLLRGLGGRLTATTDLDQWLMDHEAGWRDLTPAHRGLLLDSYLGLVSFARREVISDDGIRRREPFLTVQVQLWLRELRHLVQRVSAEPSFAWAADVPAADGKWLPIAYCRSCGGAGWATFQREADQQLQNNVTEIGRAWLNRERTCRYVALGHAAASELFAGYLHPHQLTIDAAKPGETRADHLPVRIGSDCSEKPPQRFLRRCPDCDADLDEGLSLLGSRAPSLLSVAISHLFQTGYNKDKKLLAFTDSVQDASHRAGFFAARTYRFNLRTAIQGVLEESDGDLPMVGFEQRLLTWVATRRDGSLRKAVATLLPADLVELDEYRAFAEQGGEPGERLLESLLARASWEVTMEYGYAARVGRTLERTHCSTAGVDSQGLAEAAEVLALELGEGDLLDQAVRVEVPRVRHFLAGLLARLRVVGGIDHPLLHGYIRHGGNSFFLTKRKSPLLSPFGPQSRLPRFLTDSPPDGRSVLLSVVGDADKWTWHRDWAARALGIHRKDRGIGQLYRRALQRLTERGLVAQYVADNRASVFGLRREAMMLTKRVAVLLCTTCRHEEIVPAAVAAEWEGRTCLRYRCAGALHQQHESNASYYGRRYRSGEVERVFAQEHTGLLSREVRERIENEFKRPTQPAAPNLFVCTPTLELGVDIGDLSATVLCSVPPTTANFLQRVGRAGRVTGNALCLTMAEDRPHDLYFHAEPQAMMRGQVLPPGCFLDAPEMLRRQLVAFAMDAWARQETALTQIPPRTTLILGDDGAAKFPGRFLAFYRQNGPELVESFLLVFGREISPENQARLREFGGVVNVEEVVRKAFDRIRDEREELRQVQRRTRERLQRIEEDRDAFDDPDEERELLAESERLVRRLMAELGQKYPLNVLTDAGVLPNYAFPEPGVTLKAVLQGRSDAEGKPTYEPQEYMRPASSAIRELAPWNTFYAEGRRLVIQELDLGNRAQPLHAPWRLCAACHHLQIVVPGRNVERECPRCQDPRWSDSGQVRELVKFQRVRSLLTRLEAAVGDDGEDRDEAFYQVEDLIDVGPEQRNGARLVEDLPFGIELLKDLPLRELNFGNAAEPARSGQTWEVAGRKIGPEGFSACVDCGRVKSPEQPRVDHAPWCPGRGTRRNTNSKREALRSVLLFREVRSEAIRVLLPVAEVDQAKRILSFKAALELGFRRRFAGNPRHLQIRVQDEPLAGEGRRRFLVVFDTVPGGTGYLSELWHGDHFRDVLGLALRALEECGCQRRDPPAEGCYQCLYAYQAQRHLSELSNREARAMLQEILRAWPRLQPQQTLSGVSLAARLESELERFFLRELQAYAERTQLPWTEGVRAGQVYWTLTVPGRTWEIHAQVDLGHREGVAIPCRPDFLLKPADGHPAVLPIAVFCDGLEYHARPGVLEGRIADDTQKRAALVASGCYRVWSITWKDVVEFSGGAERCKVPPILGELDGRKVGPVWQKLGLTLPREHASRPSVALLLDYLRQPDADQWRQAAAAATVIWLMEGQPLATDFAGDLENKLTSEPKHFTAGTLKQVEKGGQHFARWDADAWVAFLGSTTRSAVERRTFTDARLTLRLFDDASARASADFEASWRRFLQAWNVLQFHPGLGVYTSELIGIEEPAPARVLAPVLKVADAADPLAHLAGLTTAEVLALARTLVARGAAVPQVGYELMADDRVVAEAEMAWPAAKVAVLVEAQREAAQEFENAGWQVVDATEEQLALALELEPKDAREDES